MQQRGSESQGSTTGQTQRSPTTSEPQSQREPSGRSREDAQPPRQGQTGPSTQGQTAPSGERAQDRQSPTGQQGQRERNGGRETTGAAPSGGVAVSTEQKTKIKQHMGALRTGRMDRAEFSISVGTTVPRSVTLHSLPSEIVEIVPAWRNYRYVMVQDQIVIIDPETYRIVAVLEV
ncbi:MAG: DUF1236 domain-containing protein [Variibacter sp.]|nr:DUF1236 domain-containing protein [Variibacter sp.]